MVPSASALIVLLAAVSAGQLLFGIAHMVAFGVGMAVVLAGLAAATMLARQEIVAPRSVGSWPLARTATIVLPVLTGVAVLVIGSVVTLAAWGASADDRPAHRSLTHGRGGAIIRAVPYGAPKGPTCVPA
jgi:ABC-type nickel/cobalt efflux system permease component RcnA